MSCFKIRAKTLRISLGHTFHPIEPKLGVLPMAVIQNQRKIKNRIKKSKIWISISASAQR
jgi:formaldehyde-activating enzyme involved in methanogenesis